jgi:2-hydroxy-3-keto-5-methylthiopentenyl-1-phosphate phosphatase
MADAARKPAVFLDFDGTISRVDVVDAILDRYADRGWLRVEQEWKAGRIGSRACLAEQIGLVRAARADVDGLLATIQIDPGFVPLLRACDAAAVRVHIVSDGFDYCIAKILQQVPEPDRPLLDAVTVCASHLEPAAPDRWRATFRFMDAGCEHGCATCKPAVMDALNPAGAPAIFVGDGLSDRYAAAAADVVFAKDTLAAHCAGEGISFFRYETLADVAAYVSAAGLLRETHEYR